MAHHDPRDYVLGQELRIRILTTGAETSGRHDVVEAFQFPDTATPLHLHMRYEERLFVLEGESTLWIGPDMVPLRPGDYYAIPLNTPHAIKAGPNGCRSLLITSPAGFAELIARAATPAQLAEPDTEIDLELFTSVSSDLGDQILGPPGTVPADLCPIATKSEE
jgi:mannose-6-phosphate isomerase-like protein (cupin superfamily)